MHALIETLGFWVIFCIDYMIKFARKQITEINIKSFEGTHWYLHLCRFHFTICVKIIKFYILVFLQPHFYLLVFEGNCYGDNFLPVKILSF